MESPALSMLWEPHDPVQQLEQRFGFSGAAAVAEWVAEALGRGWGIEVTACEQVVVSSWNAMAWVVAGDRRLVAKWSALPHRFSRLDDAAHLVAWLDRNGVPVAAPVPAEDGRLLVALPNGHRGALRSRLPLPGSRFLLGVLPVVEGDLLDVDDAGQVAEAGRLLATTHEALAAYPDRIGRRGTRRPDEQLVHHDFRSANILHDGSRITAVLDFEEVTYASRVADLARAAVLLGTRYRNWRPTSEAVRTAFVTAYDEHATQPLTAREWERLEGHLADNLQGIKWASG